MHVHKQTSQVMIDRDTRGILYSICEQTKDLANQLCTDLYELRMSRFWQTHKEFTNCTDYVFSLLREDAFGDPAVNS